MLDFGTSGELGLLTVAAGGMNAQRTALDLAARNVAAAQASSPGHPYSRLVAHFSGASDGPTAPLDTDLGTDAEPEFGALDGDDSANSTGGVGITSERGSGDALAEMIAALDAQRAYEQNASVFDIGKRLAERTIDLGRS